MEYKIIDANTFFGAYPKRQVDSSVESLLGIMGKYQVEGALVTSIKGIFYDFQLGNDETKAVCGQRGRGLMPVATIDPRKYLGCVAEVGRRVNEGFKMFRFFPDLQGWPVELATFHKILEELGRLKVPVMITANQLGMPTQVTKVTRGLDIPVILCSVNYWNLGEVLTLAKEEPRIFIETHLLDSPDAIEIVTSEVGADRLIFGSNSPLGYFLSAFLPIQHAELSDEDKGKILGGNILGIIGNL